MCNVDVHWMTVDVHVDVDSRGTYVTGATKKNVFATHRRDVFFFFALVNPHSNNFDKSMAAAVQYFFCIGKSIQQQLCTRSPPVPSG